MKPQSAHRINHAIRTGQERIVSSEYVIAPSACLTPILISRVSKTAPPKSMRFGPARPHQLMSDRQWTKHVGARSGGPPAKSGDRQVRDSCRRHRFGNFHCNQSTPAHLSFVSNRWTAIMRFASLRCGFPSRFHADRKQPARSCSSRSAAASDGTERRLCRPPHAARGMSNRVQQPAPPSKSSHRRTRRTPIFPGTALRL